MNLPREFEYYVRNGIVRKCSIDRQRAEFLINESLTSSEGLKERLEKIGINDKNANSIVKDCYDIMMEVIRSKLLLAGFNSSGKHAHEAEVSFLIRLGISEIEVSLLNDLRYFRNSVTYYGKILDKGYAEKVVEFFNKFYPKMMALATL